MTQTAQVWHLSDELADADSTKSFYVNQPDENDKEDNAGIDWT